METSPGRAASSPGDASDAPEGGRLTVDLSALAENYRALRRRAPAAAVAPVLKADAYGLGAAEVGGALYAEGARSFFVARLAEGEALRSALPGDAELFVLDGCTEGSADRLLRAELIPVLNSAPQLRRWRDGGGGLPAAALHVDTGINRLGLSPGELEAIAADGGPRPRLLMSHLACAGAPQDPMNRLQCDRFEAARRVCPGAAASLANTEGLYLGAGYHYDLVRPGLGLYGGGPGAAPGGDLRPVARLTAPVLQVRSVAAGERIGYGGVFTAPRALSVAIVGAGYADGVLRPQASGGYGWLHGGRRPFLGLISMDLLALDVTDCPRAAPGDEVELLGPHVTLAAAAAWSGLTPYEALCRSDRRRRSWSSPRA